MFGTEFGYGHMTGIGWWAMLAFWIALFAVLVFVLLQASSSNRSASPGQRTPDASDVLATRFARGEIDEDEYRQRRDVLER